MEPSRPRRLHTEKRCGILTTQIAWLNSCRPPTGHSERLWERIIQSPAGLVPTDSGLELLLPERATRQQHIFLPHTRRGGNLDAARTPTESARLSEGSCPAEAPPQGDLPGVLHLGRRFRQSPSESLTTKAASASKPPGSTAFLTHAQLHTLKHELPDLAAPNVSRSDGQTGQSKPGWPQTRTAVGGVGPNRGVETTSRRLAGCSDFPPEGAAPREKRS
ncbi:unnamed protein product [Rangifer tarandus platyrhynchus]|uniref:Uncharacterized protein n=1 Tax=Rangifer tarandus platyrhynchus TaxID=3082113 RepID=A0AC59YWY9_RANTA